MPNGGVNPELAVVLQMHEARKKERSRRWAVVVWSPEVTFYETEQEARDALARTPVMRRAGLVDRKTGHTWASRPSFASVMGALRRLKAAPERFRRMGVLGKLKRQRGAKT